MRSRRAAKPRTNWQGAEGGAMAGEAMETGEADAMGCATGTCVLAGGEATIGGGTETGEADAIGCATGTCVVAGGEAKVTTSRYCTCPGLAVLIMALRPATARRFCPARTTPSGTANLVGAPSPKLLMTPPTCVPLIQTSE